MPAKEIKDLRETGKLEEAYAMALSEMQSNPGNIWGKRNLSWVLYAQMSTNAENLPAFLLKLEELKALELPASEEMLFDTICVAIAKAVRFINNQNPFDQKKLLLVFDAIKMMPLNKKGKWYSVMFTAFQKQMKLTNRYIEFADWWGFENFLPENFEKEKILDGKEIMSIVEQAYIAYAKNLLPKYENGQTIFNKEKVEMFLPKLDVIVENYPQFLYPPYFKAKLLLSLGDKENMLAALIPFAKKKKNDFWVWQIFAEAYSNDADKVFACYCRALCCKSPEMMMVGLRQKMAKLFIDKQLYDEAKLELDLIIKTKTIEKDVIPTIVNNWTAQDWYKNAKVKNTNIAFYKTYAPIADALLFGDIPEETIIVEFVNVDKKMFNFIASETKFGYLKYDHLFKEVKVGDVLKVRFQSGTNEGMHYLYTAIKVNDDVFKNEYFKEVEGMVKIIEGKPFGFLGDIFITPSLVAKLKLINGMHFKGNAIKSFNKDKKQWSWKLV